MFTQRLTAEDAAQVAKIWRDGGTVAFPTETVYGLGADATNPDAVQRIFAAKGRPSDNPLIVHLFDPVQLDDFCQSIPEFALRFLAAFCPGPLTLVLPKKAIIAAAVTAGLPSVAVRFPAHPTARRLLDAARLPIAAPSANRSGGPSATTWQAVIEDLEGRIDAVVCDIPCAIGLESTVLDCTQSIPIVLRSGSITLAQLRTIDPRVAMHQPLAMATVNSPGLRHRHYQPRAVIRLCKSPSMIETSTHQPFAYIGLDPFHHPMACLVQACRDLDEYGRLLFDFFRRCDNAGVSVIWCQEVEPDGLGQAIMDRLRRAGEVSDSG